MKDKLEAWLEIIAQLEAKIADGQTKKALKQAREHKDFPDEEGELLRLSARWSTNERNRLEGLLTESSYKVENNLITKSLWAFLSETAGEIKTTLVTIEKGQTSTKVAEEMTLPNFSGKSVIVVNYAQEDQQLWLELKKHLFIFLRDEQLQFIDIHEDVPLGVTDTFAYQEKLVTVAQRVLSLVTPNIMAFPTFMLAEQALAEAKLIPLRLEKVELEDSPFTHDIRGLPADGRFVSEWPNKNSALADIAKHLRPVFKQLKAKLS